MLRRVWDIFNSKDTVRDEWIKYMLYWWPETGIPVPLENQEFEIAIIWN